MTLWTSLLIFILYLSSYYVDTYLLYNFGQSKRPRVPQPFQQSLAYCFLNNKWSQCPVVLRNTVLNMLANANEHAREAHHQSELILHKLFEVGHNHDRRAHTENIAQPVLAYPQLTKQTTPLSWLPQRRTINENDFRNPLFPSTTTATSLQTTKFLQNSTISSKRPITNTNFSPWHTTLDPETSLNSHFKSVETTTTRTTVNPAYNTPSYERIVPTAIDNANASKLHVNSEATPPVTIIPVSKPLITTVYPKNTKSLIYNVEIGVKTKSDDKSIKRYITLNAYTEIPKNINQKINMSSTNYLNKTAAETNHTLSTAAQYRITSSKKSNHSITPLSPEEIEAQRRNSLFDSYVMALDKLERKLYVVTFNILKSTSPVERRENGISFVQSGLFLSMHLMAFSTETDQETKAEIDQCLGLNITDADKIYLIKDLMSKLPKSSFDLKLRWSSRLVLGTAQNVSENFRCGAAVALNLLIGKLQGNETDEILANSLNQMIEEDSGGAIRNTFEPEELSDGVRAVALTMLYMRGRWRSAPTVLNGTRPFCDADGTPTRTVRMIRINDYVRYGNFEDWNFQAIEIFYATRGLSLLMLVPHGRSLRELAGHLETVSIAEITRRMITMRVAVTMPLYTLRMTLLLPSKLKDLGINKLISSNNATDNGQLKLSHAVQRLMFWAEAGRNAFKDDGIEWDAEPELELVVDRPYIFFVRWHNITLMSGNFVL